MVKKQFHSLTFYFNLKILASKAVSVFNVNQSAGLIFSWLLNNENVMAENNHPTRNIKNQQLFQISHNHWHQ